VESERLRLRIEALERLAAESRHAEEARREREERSRRSAEERRRHEADVLGRVTTDIEASLNLDTVVARVAEGARELCGGDVVGVALRESGSGAMVFRFWSGLHGVNNAALRVGEGTGLAARVLETRRAARTGRYASDPRIGPEYRAIAEHETITALMAVPMLHGDRVEGIIYVFDLLWAATPGWAPDDAGLELRVVQRGQAIRTIDYLATCAIEGRSPSSYARGLRYALAVPLRAGGRVLGTLSLWSAERAYSRADEEFVTAVGSLLALRLAPSAAR
jgi:GAF domain-containing protein